ncbi:calcium ATPase transmembrane domain M-containing protein [Gymnopilus junonius]|uniref:Calcium ATPase transmembrane domain M-containing protein n=1 Tax=Gymnopilus junonius TaxID=109634 RepID=A0A9P5NFZ5_GYMJU|nr:calcium ATPase transmembrane domain M-containing protein [Gymnopilus junonius]
MAPQQTQKSFENEASHDVQIQYRTLSIHVEEKLTAKTPADQADAIREIDIHTVPVDLVYQRFSTSPTLGLESPAVSRRMQTFGKNIISPPKTQYWKKGLNYVFGGFNFLMWIAFIVTILLVIIVSATFYAVVDFHASRIMKSIRGLIAEEATVVRDGEQKTVAATDIVVGDLVLLTLGNPCSRDIRIVEASSDLRFDRSLSLERGADMIPGSVHSTSENAMETRNLALTSTFVVQGKCTGVVFATGDRTIMGRIVAMSGETKFKLTTVQKEVWFFTKIISAVALGLFCIAIIVWAAWLKKTFPGFESASEAIINSIGCLTAFVPQGLPVCVALSLTIVARRMAARHVLVKNLATIETLGCMSVLCSDKTGTLTEGNMSVRRLAVSDAECSLEADEADVNPFKPQAAVSLKSSPPLPQLALIARFCNGAKFEGDMDGLSVSPTCLSRAILRILLFFDSPEESLHRCFSMDQSADVLTTLLETNKKIFEIPFNSRNKWMMSLVREDTKSGSPEPWMLIKGAPDILFPSVSFILDSTGAAVPFHADHQSRLSQLQHQWSSEGQRVIAVCKRSLDALKLSTDQTDLEEMLYDEIRDLTLVGLISIRDPPRADVKGAVRIIRAAGVRVFMVTGDFMITAVAIAKQKSCTAEISDDEKKPKEISLSLVGAADMKPTEDDPIRALVLTGEDVERLTAADWNVVLTDYTEIVFARTTPEQKMLIVEETRREVITSSLCGSDVAKEAGASSAYLSHVSGSHSESASIILLNNDFSSIPVAIELGRLVFDNLKKVILYLMPAGTYTEFITVFSNVFLGMQLALSSYLQVCFSITNDVVMSISLMYEQPESDLMARKPRNARTERLTDWRFFFQIYLFMGLMMWPCAMSMWFLYMSEQGLRFHDVILVYNKWEDGFQGFTIDQLTHFVAVGQCIYYITMVFMQYGGLLSVRNRRVSIINSNPLWGPRRNLVVPIGMVCTALIGVTNLYGPGLQRVFGTTPIPGKFWGIPFAFALGILMVDETRKLIVRSYPKSIIAKMAW